MAQHDYDVANGSGSTVRADINALADAIVSHNSGTSAPSVTFGGMFWLDTTNHVFKVRNEANSAWATFMNADGTLAANSVGNASIRQGAALSVIGVTGNATANVADIAAGTDGFVLRRSGTALAFGTIATAGLGASQVTNAKLAQMANSTIKGRITSGTGDPEDLSAANVKTILALVKGDVGLGNVDNTSDATKFTNTALTGTPTAPTATPGTNTTQVSTTAFVNTAIAGAIASGVADGDKGDVVVSALGTVWTIDSGVVTGTKIASATIAGSNIASNTVANSNLANMANSTMKGRLTAGSGAPEDLSVANVKTLLAYTKSDISLGNVDNYASATAAEVNAGTASRFLTAAAVISAMGFFGLTDGASIAVAHTNGPNQKVTLAGNRAMAAPSAGLVGIPLNIWVVQDGTGSRTLTWDAVYDFGDYGTPVLSTVAGSADLLTFLCLTTTKFAFLGIRKRVD